MTKKEYYDLLIRCARDETFPSIDDQMSCRYRGPAGKKCAAGVLIPDEKYFPCLETRLVTDPLVMKALGESLPEGLTWGDLRQCQSIHDNLCMSGWTADRFVDSINTLEFFGDCHD